MSLMTKGNEQHLGTRLPALTAAYGRQLPLLEAGSEGQHIPAWGADCTIQTLEIAPGLEAPKESRLRGSTPSVISQHQDGTSRGYASNRIQGLIFGVTP